MGQDLRGRAGTSITALIEASARGDKAAAAL